MTISRAARQGWYERNAYTFQYRKDLDFTMWLNINDPEESTKWVNS